MADISKITLPNGTTYDIKDTVARNLIAGGITFVVSWDGTSKPAPSEIPLGVKVKHNGTTYTGTMPASSAEPGAFYLVASDIGDSGPDYYDEYVAAQVDSTTKVWEKLGGKTLNLEGLQVTYKPKGSVTVSVAKSTAGGLTVSPAATGTATYTPEGAVTVTPTKNTAGSLTVSPASTGAATYTPEGTVSQPTFSGSEGDVTVSASYTPAGGVTTASTENKTATVSAASTGAATYTPTGDVTLTAPSGSIALMETHVEVEDAPQEDTPDYTPSGTVSQPTFSGTAVRLVTGNIAVPKTYTFTGTAGSVSVSATHTPAGSVTAPTISVKTAGNSTTIKKFTAAQVVTDMAAGSSASGTALDYCTYDAGTETLRLYKIAKSTTATSDQSVRTGDAAYQATQPTFTGTKATINSTGSFTPAGGVTTASTENKTTTVSAANSGDATYTPSGTVSQPTFDGTGVMMFVGVPDLTDAENLPGASFSGTAVRLVTGNIAVPKTYTFSGAAATITSTGKFTPSGTVSKPTFSGTGKRLKVDGTDVVVGISSTKFTGSGTRLKLDSSVVMDVGTSATFTGTQETVPVTSSDANAGSH